MRWFLSFFRKRRLIDEPPLARYVAVHSFFTTHGSSLR